MADVTLVNSGSANGTVTPATMTTAAVAAGNLVVCVIVALGTSPTIATPTGSSWVQTQKTQGATLSMGMYHLLNPTGSTKTPSSVLGGTVTGWLITTFEFTATGSNCGLQGSAMQTSAVAQLTNLFNTSGQAGPNTLFVYSIGRATATITPANTTPVNNAVWSTSVQPQAGVQGLSLDTYWYSNLGQGAGQYPTGAGLLSGAVASVAIGAWFNTIASQGASQDTVGGQSGVYVPQFFNGMIGG